MDHSMIKRVASRHLKELDTQIMLKSYGLDGLLSRGSVIAYHGTTIDFSSFDMSFAREELVEKFYGKAFFFVTKKETAWRYAWANRNFGLPSSVIQEISKVRPQAGAFLKLIYTLGFEKGWDAWMQSGQDVHTVDGMDINDIQYLAPYIIGTKEPHTVQQSLFGSSTTLDDWIFETLDEIGLDSDAYKPKVYTVLIKGIENVLVTESQREAGNARKNGYDCVVYYGRDLVDNVPEIALYDPQKIKILKKEV